MDDIRTLWESGENERSVWDNPLHPEGVKSNVWDHIKQLLEPIWLRRHSYLTYLASGVSRLRELWFSREEITAYCDGKLHNSSKQEMADNLFMWWEDESQSERLIKEYDILMGTWNTGTYMAELQTRLSKSWSIPQKYNAFLSKLVMEGKIHNYMYVWEGGHGKAIIVFDYYSEPTKISIIKLSKHKSEWIEVVGNFIEEASVQFAVAWIMSWESDDRENLAIQKAISTPKVQLKVPHLYTKARVLSDKHQSSIDSQPQQWILSMEYTNGETIESLLWLSDFYESHFKDIKKILERHQNHPYIWWEIIKKLELYGYDFESESCQVNHIIRLLTKKDIIEILKVEWVKISDHAKPWEIPEKQHKHWVNYTDATDLAKAISIFLKIHGDDLWVNMVSDVWIQSIAKEGLKVLKSFIEIVWKKSVDHPHKPGQSLSLKHRDLNGSNIMIDIIKWDDGHPKMCLWIIDYGATDESNSWKLQSKKGK